MRLPRRWPRSSGGKPSSRRDPPDVDAIVDFDLRFWVDGLGQPETRVPAAIRDKVREMDAGQYAADRVSGHPIPLMPPANARLADLRCPVLAVAGELDVSEVAQTARHLEAQAPERAGRDPARCRAHDRHGGPRRARRADRRVPGAVAALVVTRGRARSFLAAILAVVVAACGGDRRQAPTAFP